MSDPLWVAVEEHAFPRLDGRVDVDVAVVGGGFSGLGAAWAAQKEGASVALVESRTIASGASGRNAGFLLSGPAMGFLASIQAVGLEQTLEIWRLTEQNHAELLALIDGDCGYLRRGSMTLAASETEWTDLQEECRQMQDCSLNVCLVPAMSLPKPFDRMYQGGLYHAGNAEMNPGAFLRGVAHDLSKRAMIFERTRVETIEKGSPLRLRCVSGTVVATRLIMATNAYTPALLPGMPIAATRGQVASTTRMDEVIVPFPMYADHGYQYWRQTADGCLVVGGWRNRDMESEVGTDEVLNASIQSDLDRFIRRIAPGASVQRRWAGIMGFTPDHFPLVGAVPRSPGVFMAAGYSGHGVAMAFICGALAALSSLGRQVAIPAAFSPHRFARS